MTNAPRTLTLSVNDMAALIIECAVQLASITVRQLTQEHYVKAEPPEGWTDRERAEVVADAEKATSGPGEPNPGASEGEGLADCGKAAPHATE